jgi:predicted enzyme related to lactoylglutathione lyase
MNSPLTWFEIPVHDLERATTFYETVFATTLRRSDPNMSVFNYTLGYPSGCLVKSDHMVPARTGTLVYFDAAHLDGKLAAALARALESGGRPIMPRTDIGEHGFIAVFEDPEGNAIGLHENPS